MPPGTNKTIAAGLTEFEWEVRESRSGAPTLLLGGRAVYSQYDPLKNAAELAGQIKEQMGREGCDHLVLIGSGLGYLPAALYDAGVERMVVWEPFSEMQKVFGHLYQDGPERVFDQATFAKKIKAFARTGAKPKIVVHPGYDLFSWYEYSLVYMFLQRIYGGQYDPVVSRRSLENLRLFPRFGTIKNIAGRLKGQKAILAVPGPSLKQHVSLLQQNRTHVLFAPVQALPFLQKNGIHADCVINAETADMGDFIRECSSDFGLLLTDTLSDPNMLQWLPDKTLLFNLRSGQVHEDLWQASSLPSFEPLGATVSDVMFDLADYFGLQEIICMGMDLCWQKEKYAYRSSNRFDAGIQEREKTFGLQTVNGDKAVSNKDFFHSARFIAARVRQLALKGVEIYQLPAGVDLGGRVADDLLLADLVSGKDRGVRITGANAGGTGTRPISAADSVRLYKKILGMKPVEKNDSVSSTLTPRLRLREYLQPLDDTEKKGMLNRMLAETEKQIHA